LSFATIYTAATHFFASPSDFATACSAALPPRLAVHYCTVDRPTPGPTSATIKDHRS